MTAALILNQSQAEAVYSAMCALRSVAAIEGGISLRLPLAISGDYEWVKIDETDRDVIRVAVEHANRDEHHAGRAAFATAYGLDQTGLLYAIHSLDDDRWLANVRAAHPGAAIRDYENLPQAQRRVYAVAA